MRPPEIRRPQRGAGLRDIVSTRQLRQRFLTFEPAFDPFATAAHFLDGFFTARGLPLLFRRVAHLVILPAGHPRPVLLATAT